jgi:hypothetical protein
VEKEKNLMLEEKNKWDDEMKWQLEYMLCDFLKADDANKDKMKRVRDIWMSEMF